MIMIKEFTNDIGVAYSVDMVAIYNYNRISEEDVTTLIQEGGENKNVIIVTKKQYESVFK